MKTLLLPSALLIMILWSCKKEKPEPEQNTNNPTSAYVLPSTIGSYWVFEKRNVDSLGNETFMGIDTLSIYGDTVINGNTYISFNATSYTGTFYHPPFLRDSLGYLVDNYGTIQYSYTNLGDTINSWSSPFPGPNGAIQLEVDDYMSPSITSVSTPSGQFNSYHKKSVWRDSAGGPINECGDIEFIANNYYSSNVGMIRFENWYFGSMVSECKYFYYQLIDYHIAP